MQNYAGYALGGNIPNRENAVIGNYLCFVPKFSY